VPHDGVPGPGGVQPSAHDFLVDHAELGLALLAWWRDTGDPDLLAEARAVADTLLARFGGEAPGLLYDAPPPSPSDPARMQVRLAPLADDARAALFLLRLDAASPAPHCREAALACLRTWSGALAAQSPWTAALLGTSILAALPLP
jgi:uncharacterized protein YyaL (SSP411 family)